MTAKRFTVPKRYRCIQDNQTEEKYLCEDKSEAIALANLLNALHEENNNLKQALWEAESDYIHERYEYSFEIEQELDDLKKEFERGYWND